MACRRSAVTLSLTPRGGPLEGVCPHSRWRSSLPLIWSSVPRNNSIWPSIPATDRTGGGLVEEWRLVGWKYRLEGRLGGMVNTSNPSSDLRTSVRSASLIYMKSHSIHSQRMRADSIVEGLSDEERYFKEGPINTDESEHFIDYWPSASLKKGVRTRKSTIDRGLRRKNRSHKRERAQNDPTARKAVKRVYSTQSWDF